jgi:hypothetical protein
MADPGDIYPAMPRVPPPADLTFKASPIMTEHTFNIQGLQVRCAHLKGGVFIRKDDYEDLQLLLQPTFSMTAPSLPVPFVKLAIRSLWEGQSFIRVNEFRGYKNRRVMSPYHESRISAFHCKLIIIVKYTRFVLVLNAGFLKKFIINDFAEL